MQMINLFAGTITLGLSGALDTLFSQTFGSSNRKNLGVQLQRGM